MRNTNLLQLPTRNYLTFGLAGIHHRPLSSSTQQLEKQPIPLSLLKPTNQLKLPQPLLLPPFDSQSKQKNLTSTQIIQKVIKQSNKSLKKSTLIKSSSSSTPWPINLRIVDGWTGRGRWGEGKPDVKEWIGVDKKHKDLMRNLRVER